MIQTVNTVRTLQAVALTVGLAVFLWSTGLPTLFRSAEAASITDASDTLSNSAPSAESIHVIDFETPNGMAIGETLVLSFEAGFDLTTLNVADISMSVGGSGVTLSAVPGVDEWGLATGTPTAQDIQFTTPTNDGVASSTQIVITIGQEGQTMIINPSATTSYYVQIGGTMPDSGEVRVAIIDEVTVSASVETSLTFTVNGVPNGQAVNGSATTTSTSTTPIALPFETLQADSSKVLAHDLSVETNATNGYSVTVEQTGELQSSTGAVIDGFIDGAWTTTPTAWQGPSETVGDVATYGHWGLTSSDGTTTRAAEFGSDQWVSGSTTPIVVMGHDGPSDGVFAGSGSARVGYQIQISSLQEAGNDYSTTLRYIATPTF